MSQVHSDAGDNGMDSGTADDGGPDSAFPDARVPDAAISDDAGSSPDTGASSDSGLDGDKIKVEIHFKAKLGEQELACGRSYNEGALHPTVELRDLRMFVQDVTLVRASDQAEVALVLEERAPWQHDDVVLLDFEDRTGGCVGQGSAGTNTVITGFVEPGEYAGIKFRNGVPEAKNHESPTNLTAPLSSGPLHWGWLFGFIFFKAELQSVLDGGVGAATIAHVGSRMCSGAPGHYACQQSNRNRVELAFDSATQAIIVDVGVLFADTDLAGGATCHSDTLDHCGTFFQRLGVDFESGAALGGAAIYRVEPM